MFPDSSQFQQPGTPYPSPYLGVSEGPLGDLQSQVASVLNANGNENSVWVAMQNQVGQPIVQVPNVRIPIVSILRRLMRR